MRPTFESYDIKMNLHYLIALLSLAFLGAARPDPQDSTDSDNKNSGSGTSADTGGGGADSGSSVQSGESLSKAFFKRLLSYLHPLGLMAGQRLCLNA